MSYESGRRQSEGLSDDGEGTQEVTYPVRPMTPSSFIAHAVPFGLAVCLTICHGTAFAVDQNVRCPGPETLSRGELEVRIRAVSEHLNLVVQERRDFMARFDPYPDRPWPKKVVTWLDANAKETEELRATLQCLHLANALRGHRAGP